jgi:hypothetical protein
VDNGSVVVAEAEGMDGEEYGDRSIVHPEHGKNLKWVWRLSQLAFIA